jgi:hypothetical protein
MLHEPASFLISATLTVGGLAPVLGAAAVVWIILAVQMANVGKRRSVAPFLPLLIAGLLFGPLVPLALAATLVQRARRAQRAFPHQTQDQSRQRPSIEAPAVAADDAPAHAERPVIPGPAPQPTEDRGARVCIRPGCEMAGVPTNRRRCPRCGFVTSRPKTVGASEPHIVRSSSNDSAAVLVSMLLALTLLGVLVRPSVVLIAVVIFAALMTWRACVLGVHVKPDCIVIVGFAKSITVDWADIDRFEVRPWNGYRYVGWVIRRSGQRPIHLVGISTGNRSLRGQNSLRKKAQDPIDQLNLILETRKTTPPQPALPAGQG